MCVIDQPARALYHHSIGKSDESQPEDTPHQQPPPLPPPSSGKKFLKKMDDRLPAPPSPQSVRNPDQPQSKSPRTNTRTPDAEFTQQADRTPPPPSVRITGLSSTELRSGTRKPAPVPSMPPTSLPHNLPPPQPSTPPPQKKSHQHERPRTKDHGALSSHADAVCQRTCRSPRHHLQYL